MDLKKSSGISNFIISADLHGRTAPEESLNWKSQFPGCPKTTHSLDVTTCLCLKMFLNLKSERPRQPPRPKT